MDHFGSEFLKIKKNNKDRVMNAALAKELPLDFIKQLFHQGKLTTQIHKALLQKGYVIHIQTLRNRLLRLDLDYRENYRKFLKNRGRISRNSKELIKQLWRDGKSINEISRKTGFAFLTVRTYLHQMGFKTKMLQFYYSESSNAEEKMAKSYLENQKCEVKKCLFLCQRKLDRPFNEILVDKTFPFPSDLRKFCTGCPVKELKFEEQELYDFVSKDEKGYSVVEVKKVYKNPHRRAHFTLGQFLNLSKVIKAGIPFKLLIFEDGQIQEKQL